MFCIFTKDFEPLVPNSCGEQRYEEIAKGLESVMVQS